jgi:hypothetical protein
MARQRARTHLLTITRTNNEITCGRKWWMVHFEMFRVSAQNGAGEGKGGLGNRSYGRLSQGHACASPSLLPGSALFWGTTSAESDQMRCNRASVATAPLATAWVGPSSLVVEHPPATETPPTVAGPHKRSGAKVQGRWAKSSGCQTVRLTVVDPTAAATAASVCPCVVLMWVGVFQCAQPRPQRSAFPPCACAIHSTVQTCKHASLPLGLVRSTLRCMHVSMQAYSQRTC